MLIIVLLAFPGCGDGRTPVEVAPVASVNVQPSEHLLAVGQTVRLTAVPRSATGEALAGRAVAWRSEAVSVVTVGGDGVVTAYAEGTTWAVASVEGRTGRARITVRAADAGAPAPELGALAPSSALAGAVPPPALTVRGTGFVPASRVRWDGQERATEYVSAGELRARLEPADLAQARTVPVQVVTPAPGGGTSAALTFTVHPVDAPAPAPVIRALAPAQITAGWPGPFTLTVTGEGFTWASRVLWNGVPRETRVVSATELAVTVTPADVAGPGAVTVSVETPAPGGGRAEATFPVHAVPVARVEIRSLAGASWTWRGEALALQAVPLDALGRELAGRAVRWTSGAEGVARVNPDGVVVGDAVGAALITATVDGVAGTRPVAVHDAPAAELVFDAGSGADRHLALWTPGRGLPPRRLAVGMPAFDPAPSPDGASIAFTGVGPDGNVDVYVVGRDGAGLRRLTTYAGVDAQPAWSPDGRWIAFATTRAGANDVWVMPADGGDARRLTRAGAGEAGSGDASGAPAWSPDGTHLVYVVGTGGDTDLWVMGADGSGKRQLTATAANDLEPTWSPDGRAITFRREGGPTRELALVSVLVGDGSPVASVANPGDASAPAYSPDGRYLTFAGPERTGAPLSATPVGVLAAPRTLLPPGTPPTGRNAAWLPAR